MNEIQDQPVTPGTETAKREWVKPELSKMDASATEFGDNVAGEGPGLFS